MRLKDLGGPAFVKRYALYRFLRRKGWCVRSGLPYGCDYCEQQLLALSHLGGSLFKKSSDTEKRERDQGKKGAEKGS